MTAPARKVSPPMLRQIRYASVAAITANAPIQLWRCLRQNSCRSDRGLPSGSGSCPPGDQRGKSTSREKERGAINWIDGRMKVLAKSQSQATDTSGASRQTRLSQVAGAARATATFPARLAVHPSECACSVSNRSYFKLRRARGPLLMKSNPVSMKNKTVAALPKHLLQFAVDQRYDEYTPVDHAVWRFIMRQNTFFLRSAHKLLPKDSSIPASLLTAFSGSKR